MLQKVGERYNKVVQEYNDVVELYSKLNEKYEKEKKVREQSEFEGINLGIGSRSRIHWKL